MHTDLKKFVRVYSFLPCKQRNKVDCAFSSWEMLLSDVPILGRLLCNIYICDMFFETPESIDFAGYLDDNTPYTYSSRRFLIYKALPKFSFPGCLQIT